MRSIQLSKGSLLAKQFDRLSKDHRDFIARQHIFFAASATTQSRINVSPREIGALRIVGDATALYLDRTGSGNETAAHMRADGRLTLMLCSFSGPPQIMRLYGKGCSIGWDTPEFEALILEHYDNVSPMGARQIMKLDIDLVQTSCGYGVPLFKYQAERSAIDNWHDNKGPDGIQDYWQANNLTSMDGLPTGLKLRDE